jgi:hypothetical protein
LNAAKARRIELLATEAADSKEGSAKILGMRRAPERPTTLRADPGNKREEGNAPVYSVRVGLRHRWTRRPVPKV